MKRADSVSGSKWYSGVMTDNKDLRRVVLLVSEYRTLIAEVERLTAENTKLKAALPAFGRHGQWCRGKDFEDHMGNCDCGLAEAVRP